MATKRLGKRREMRVDDTMMYIPILLDTLQQQLSVEVHGICLDIKIMSNGPNNERVPLTSGRTCTNSC